MTKVHPLWKLAQTCVRIFTTVWFDLKVYGAKHVPKTGGVLMVCNHQSYLDPMLFGAQLPRPMSYMAKSELFENRFFAWFITMLNAFPVRQGAGDIGAIKETVRRLQEGAVLTIYPEGTRTLTGELMPIQPGFALVVRRAGVPVVPAVIVGSYDAWPKDDKMFRSHPIRIMYGPPMELNGMKADAIVARVEQTLREMLRQLNDANANAAARSG